MKVLLCATALAATLSNSTSNNFEDWLKNQAQLSQQKIIEVMTHPETADGRIIASPSKHHPNYFFHWVRDAALVMNATVTLIRDNPSQTLEHQRLVKLFWQYVHAVKYHQMEANSNGHGLGEPKFYISGKVYDQPWGRPQNDGPASRSITLARFANTMLDQQTSEGIRDVLYPILKRDLEFVLNEWNKPSFDLWEEVLGKHFYTQMVQRKALIDGAALANRFGETNLAEKYLEGATQILEELHKYWSDDLGYIQVTRDRTGGVDYKHSQLDVAVVLAALHSGFHDGAFSPNDSKILATAAKLEQVFGALYPINQVTLDRDNEPMSAGIGRYPEDRYDGYETNKEGNGWYLATHALGRLCYLSAEIFEKTQSIPIDEINRPYFANLPMDKNISETNRTLTKDDPEFAIVLTALRKKGDSFLRRTRYHASNEGHMAEQFNRHTGFQQGAVHLTWSYASFLKAIWSR